MQYVGDHPRQLLPSCSLIKACLHEFQHGTLQVCQFMGVSVHTDLGALGISLHVIKPAAKHCVFFDQLHHPVSDALHSRSVPRPILGSALHNFFQ